MDPASGTIYVGTFGGGVLKSVDRGATFSAVNTGLSDLALAVTWIAMDPTNPDIVITVSAGGGIFRTANGGASWSATSDVGTNVVSVAVDPLNPRTWYAGYGVGTVGAMKKSVDGGLSWTKSDSGIPVTAVWAIAIDPRREGIVYAATADSGAFKSTDGGMTWSALSIQPVVWSLAIDPSAPDVVYAGVNGDGVFKSTDAGATFTRIGSPAAGVVLSLAVDPTASNRVYAGTISGGVAVSSDGGATWRPTSVRTGTVLSLTVTADGDVYAGTTTEGVLTNARVDGFGLETRAPATQSIDNPAGETHLPERRTAVQRFRPIASRELAAINAQNIVSVTIDPRDSNHLLLGTNDGGLLGSRDGGAHWTAAGRGFLSRSARKAFFDPRNPGHVLVGSFSGGGLYLSTDDGNEWVRHLFGSPGVYVWTCTIDPSSGAIYAGTRGEGLWRSVDGGTQFARIDGSLVPQVRSIAFDPSRPGLIFVGGNTGVWRSLDDGATFKRVATPFTLSISVDPADPAVIYAATQTVGVYKSVDGGATFVASNKGLTNLRLSRSGVVAIDPGNSATLYVSSEGGGVYKSLDAGASWQTINDGLTDLAVSGLTLDVTQPNVLYAAGPHGVFQTTTGGQ